MDTFETLDSLDSLFYLQDLKKRYLIDLTDYKKAYVLKWRNQIIRTTSPSLTNSEKRYLYS